MKTSKDRSDVPALDRGLDVLEQMSQSAEPLSLTQIARAAQRTVSEVQRTVARLTRRSYLVRDTQGHYRLSTKLFRLATTHPPFRDLVARSMPPMHGFTDATTESVHLGVLSDDLLLLVAQVEGHGIVRLSLRIGTTQDPISTVSGRILLAGLGPEELEGFLARRELPAKDHARLRETCELVRERGYESAPSGRVQGVHDLGVPVLLPDGRVIAALTSCFLLPRSEKTATLEYLEPLRKAAQQIAQAYEPTRGNR
jgi:DNA-binding IclR family transcriptional regulator